MEAALWRATAEVLLLDREIWHDAERAPDRPRTYPVMVQAQHVS
jgi:hypothetical protein